MHPPLVSFSANVKTNIVCKLIVQDQINQILQQTPVALDGADIEGIHKMRVGFRRLRTAFKIFRPIIKKSTYHYFQTNLKHAGQILGNIRDLDVLHEDMIAYQVSQSTHLLENYWQQKISPLYNQYRGEFTSLVSSGQYQNLIAYLSAFCSEENAGIKSLINLSVETWSVKSFSISRIMELLNNILSYSELLNSPQPYHTYHQLRKEAKKFRYAIEFFAPILDSANIDFLIQNLVVLQDHLGNLNDTVVAAHIYSELNPKSLSFPASDKHSVITSYFEFRKQEQIRLTQSFTATWTSFLNSDPQHLVEKCIP